MSISLPQLPAIPTLSDYVAARDTLFEILTRLSNGAVDSSFQIGATSPLTVAGTSPSGAALNASANAAAVLQNGVVTLGLGVVPPHLGGTGGGAMTPGSVVFAGAAGVYYQDNSNFFWDVSNHWLGIGTAAPAGPLDIAAFNGVAYFRQAAAGTAGPHFTFRTNRGNSFSSPAVVVTADEIGEVRFDGYSGAAGFVTASAIKAFVSGTVATTRVPGYLSFWTGTDAAPTVLTERMRIQNDGKVGVGTPTPGTLLDVAGTVTATLFSGPLTGNVTGTVTGNVTGNAGGTAGSLSTVYRMRAYNSVATSLVNATSTQVTLDTELEDPNHNFATSAYTVPVTGWYIVTGSVSTGQASGILYASLYDSTSSVVILRSPFSASVAAGIGSTASFGGAVYLTAAHVLVVYGYQNSGGAVNTQTGAEGTFLNVHFLGA